MRKGLARALSAGFVVSSLACSRTDAPRPVASASAAGSAVVASPLPSVWPYRSVAEVRSSRGMVVTDNAIATRVGRDLLARGGNAVDAMVAAAFALAVAYPAAGNLGGGGFAVVRIAGTTFALDFRETAPRAARRDMYSDASGKSTAAAREGIRSAGVPGSVAGLWELYQTLGSGRFDWAALVAPAIRLAEEGLPIDAAFIGMLDHAGRRLRNYPPSAALFFPGGKPPSLGSLWKNPELARVLRRIADGGPRGFYAGPTAELLLGQMRIDRGLFTRADLEAYQARWRVPLEFTYRGQRVLAMPPPSSGGVTLALICHLVEGYDLRELGWQSPAELHYVLEAMRRAFAARNARLGDPDFVRMPLEELLSQRWADAQRATIRSDRATPSSEIPSAGAPSGTGPSTTHLAVVDASGNTVALTTTLNWWFGSAVTVKGAGFLLNNEMDDFAAVPGTANSFGLVQGDANAIAPGKRPLSSMSPTIVLGPDGGVRLVLGAAGGPTIITTVYQELSSVLDFGLDLGRAVGAPRFHLQHLPDTVTFEHDGISPDTARQLRAMGYGFTERGHIADAPAIGRSATVWVGVAEPRRPGGLAAAP